LISELVEYVLRNPLADPVQRDRLLWMSKRYRTISQRFRSLFKT